MRPRSAASRDSRTGINHGFPAHLAPKNAMGESRVNGTADYTLMHLP